MDKINLQNLLADIQGPESFTDIAMSLMRDHIIKKGNRRYAIVEIEFYLYTNDHKDIITYPRITKAGQWFFHQSGVDLTFESRDMELDESKKEEYKLLHSPLFGGVLIRAIMSLDAKDAKPIWGPQKVVNELWDKFDAFGSDKENYPVIVEKSVQEESSKLYRSKRWINIPVDKLSDRKAFWAQRIGLSVLNEEPDTLEYTYRYFYTDIDLNGISTKDYSAKPKDLKEVKG